MGDSDEIIIVYLRLTPDELDTVWRQQGSPKRSRNNLIRRALGLKPLKTGGKRKGAGRKLKGQEEKR